MPIHRLERSDGRTLFADSVLVDQSHEGGLAIGTHSPERVERHCNIFVKRVSKLGVAPVKVLLPHDLGGQVRDWCLPFFMITTWYISEPVHDANRCGSHLAVVVFQDDADITLSDENRSLIDEMQWEAFAADFDY